MNKQENWKAARGGKRAPLDISHPGQREPEPPEMHEALAGLVEAAENVVKLWECGDLAGAVNALSIEAGHARHALAAAVSKAKGGEG